MPSITAINITHLHLLLNHVPTVGTVVAIGLLILAFIRKSEHLTIAGLEVLFLIAVLTLPAYEAGVGAGLKLKDQPGVSDIAIRTHHDAALSGFTVLELAGFAGWIALWQARRHGRTTVGIVAVTTVLAIVSLGLMSRAATLGGEIRHPEIRDEAAATATNVDIESFVTTEISRVMVNSTWAWPASETVHFLGLSLIFGVLLAVNLRILGAMPHIPFSDVHRLLPWGMLGFGANLITGMLFFIGQPQQYIDSAPYYWKMVFLMIAGANFLYLTVFKAGWSAGEWNFSALDKSMAALSMFSWLAVLYGGRMLPFIGHAF
jgi:hypothetical protein